MLKNMLTIRNILLTCLFVLLQSCGGSNDKTRYSISANKTSLSFNTVSQEKSSQSLKVEVSFSGDGLLVGFSPDITAPPWLKLKTENVTSNSATILVELVDNEQYITNLYQTQIRLSTGTIEGTNVDLVHHDIDISMFVAQRVSFKTVAEESNVPSQTTTIISSTDDTWEASTEAEWLTTELKADIDTKALTLTSSANISSLTDSGSYNTEIKLKNTTTNEELIIPVELGLDNIYLFAEQPHVSLVSTPNITVTEAVISVSNNAEKNIDWAATTTVDWLTLTPLEGGNKLKISADTSKVIENEISTADITIEPTNSNDAITEVVSINLFHSTTLTEIKTLDINNLPANSNAIATSPSQPFVYIGIGNEIKIFHLYTGELLNTVIAAPENTNIEQFVMHPKGTYILAQATEKITKNGETSTEIHRYKVNLTDNTISEILDWSIVATPERIVRLSGRYFVLTSGLEFADESLKSLYFNNDEAFNPTKIEVATLTGAIFAIDNTDTTSSKIKRFNIEVNDYTKTIVASNLTHSYHPESLPETEVIQDLVVTNDESNIYIISNTSEWISFDGTSFTDNGLLVKEETIVKVDQENQTIKNEDITSSENDIVTHSVYINSLNQPHYIRTIKVPNTSPTLYETHLNTYNTQQQLIASTLTSNNTQLFNVSPVDIYFSLNAQHTVVNDKTINEVKVNLAPFIPETYQITFNTPLEKPEDSRFIVNLGDIGDRWTATDNENWIGISADTDKPKELIVNLINYSTLTSGIYHNAITVYDLTNQTSATIRVTLNIE